MAGSNSGDWNNGPEYVTAIKLAAIGVPNGGTKKIVCPKCGGGGSQERSLSVTRRAGSVFWLCHRLSCGCRGNTLSRDAAGPTPERGADSRIQEINAQLSRLSQDTESYLCDRFNIKPGTLHDYGVRYWAAKARALFPICSYRGERLGWQARSYAGEKPKTLTYKPDGSPSLAFFGARSAEPQDPLMVVEDPTSAICCAYHDVPAVALLGTHLSPEDEAVLLEACTALRLQRICVALDKDAQDKGAKLARRLSIGLETRFVPLEKDLKDMPATERRELLVQQYK